MFALRILPLMKKWIALLRGINVGGNNILPMKDLRSLLGELGYSDVKTYIQSGNCVFETAETDSSIISGKITKAIEAQFSFAPPVFVLFVDDFNSVIDANPYAQNAEINPKSVHIFFLWEPAQPDKMEALLSLSKPSERIALTKRALYLHAPEGIGRSKLAANIERKLGVSITARNYNSVMKIAKLAE